ncbi:MAG: hypothetical protein COU68_04305 [Candidatus Pacebacteria bacterium CG10_big_fil_rev_8_21_14_0_10_45_6]|nr:MAG: hypothetical protein COU68_04305 [Candidatus Pacebacteria bacterium CG10_big_fil_rev_8_21_14_0_10_45_6]
MKAFFTGSPRALKDYTAEHQQIYEAISRCGFTHLSDLVIKADPVAFYEKTNDEVFCHYKDTIECLKKADVLIAEISFHSLSMGYLVEKALGMNKPVIVLHQKNLTPFFFTGIENERLQIVAYDQSNVFEVVKNSLEYALTKQDVRFDFFVSSKISQFLDLVARVKKVPRSVYLRTLIERDMQTPEMKELIEANN